MTRETFIENHKHMLGGICLDLVSRAKSGPELSILLGQAMERIETILGRCWDESNPKPLPVKPAAPAPGNGVQQGPHQPAPQPTRR